MRLVLLRTSNSLVVSPLLTRDERRQARETIIEDSKKMLDRLERLDRLDENLDRDIAALIGSGLTFEVLPHGINVHGPLGVVTKGGYWSPCSNEFTAVGCNLVARLSAVTRAKKAMRAVGHDGF